MAAIATAFSSAFRDYNTDGVPGSGNRNTPKSDARALGSTIETYLDNTAFTSGLGYLTGVGNGGTQTQATSRTTAVTLNKRTGAITLFTAAPVVGTYFSFTVNNSLVAATDVIIVSVKSGTNTYVAQVSAVAAGSFQISMVSISGTASDAPVVNFAIIKGATN